MLFYLNTMRDFAATPRKKRSREAVPITKVCGRPTLMFAALLPSLQMLSGDSPRLSRGEQVPARSQTQRACCQWDKTSNGSRALLGAEAETSCTLIQRCPTRSTSSTRTSNWRFLGLRVNIFTDQPRCAVAVTRWKPIQTHLSLNLFPCAAGRERALRHPDHVRSAVTSPPACQSLATANTVLCSRVFGCLGLRLLCLLPAFPSLLLLASRARFVALCDKMADVLALLNVTPSIQRTEAQASSSKDAAETRDRARDLQIFSLTLSQLSYRGGDDLALSDVLIFLFRALSFNCHGRC